MRRVRRSPITTICLMGAPVVKLPAPLDSVVHCGLQETLDMRIVYVCVPLVPFRTNHRYLPTEMHEKVAGYVPEKQIVVFPDGEEHFRLIVAEQSPPPVEWVVIGAGMAQEFTPVPEEQACPAADRC